jgi:stearoyl-CoA desaturase (delta-9 desaturase)
MQWILASRHKATDYDRIKDFAKYPELVFMNKHDLAFVIGTAVVTFLIGGTTALVWGFFVSVVAAWHITFCINSVAHVLGKRRYETDDDSRNNPVLAMLAFGEGWHNNHHHYQRSARQGFYWWEIDISWYGLKLLEAMRLVWDVEGVPKHVRDQTEAPERERVAGAAREAA